MRAKTFVYSILFFAVITTGVYSQKNSTKKNNTTKPNTGNQTVTNKSNEVITPFSGKQHPEDYKIIASNSSYIEVEFYPYFNPQQKISYNGAVFSILDFENSVSKGMKESGQPDIKWRDFPLIFPSENGNTISVIDFDEHSTNGINIAPVPTYTLADPYKRNTGNIIYNYIKDSKYYSQNKFLPENIVSMDKPGDVRNLLIGSFRISPLQYNPVTGELKQYTRIRVRITFGQAPVRNNKKRSKAELELLKGIGLNSDIGISWMNPASLNKTNITTISNSIMNTGDWYKIEIKDDGKGSSDGIYKLTKSFLESSGMNLSGIDPATIKIYGNGGYFVPIDFNLPRPFDLVEIPVFTQIQTPGIFGNNDYILFYGRSTNNWIYNFSTNVYQHFLDYYSNSNYYWICINTPGNGMRMQTENSQNVSNPIVPSSFTEKLFYEPEVSNLLDEGTIFFSEGKSSGGSFVWNSTLTGLEANSDIHYTIKPASRCLLPETNNMLVGEDNSTVSQFNFPMGNADPGFGPWVWTYPFSFTINQNQKTNGEQSSFRGTYYATGADAEGYLDWMEIQYSRRFNSVSNDFIRFDSPNQTGTIEYNISSFSGNSVKVFDATVHDSVKIVQPLNTSSSNVKFQENEIQGSFHKYFAVGPNGYKTPTGISSRIPNQNLKGTNGDGASFVIITHQDLLPAANRLKAKREAGGPSNPNYLKTKIFTCDQIYNEFSGGVLDAMAIRDFLKYAYENWQEKPVYVCFLGSGNFDYRNVLGNSVTYVPPYEYSDPELDQVSGFTSDEFLVNVEGDLRPEMAVGRITAKNLEGANQYLDKVDCYEDPSSNGYWKNRMVFVADDGIAEHEGSVHNDQCENLAEQYTPSIFDKTKIYLVEYPTIITPEGIRKPDANKDIIKYWNQGCIAIHYTGHGSTEVWSHEYVLEKDVILSQLNNVCKYPFVTIASCDMSKFDDPSSLCAAELFAMSPLKAGIGTLAASRPVYGGANAELMQLFFHEQYSFRDTLLLQKRFGAGVFAAKQDFGSAYELNEQKFILICDPTLRTEIPRFLSRVDSMSGLSYDTMRALSHIKVFGSVLNPDSSQWANYNGKIFLKIFDVTRNIAITDQDGFVYNFTLPGGIIYSGTQNISNGKWVVEFIVPKDISYFNGNGRLINYFYNNLADGSSLYTNFIVGGIDPAAPIDTTGPRISLYLNNRNFRSGDVVNQNFNLIADLFDESGINTTGTIGHKIEAILDNNQNVKYDLTTFYNSDTSYKSGSLQYAFSSISDGQHTLSVRAWDTYNNSSTSNIQFTVNSNSALQLMNVYNYPNPFKDKTSFTFQHNYPNAVNVKIKVYTVAGRLIKEIDQNNINDKFVEIDWNGKDQDGQTLSNGIYIYKLVVTSVTDGSNVSDMGKLAVLR